jgi:hypothetical protein
MGFLFDPAAGAIRTIAGIPGAAIVGGAAAAARNAAVAPGLGFVLLEEGPDQPLKIWQPEAPPERAMRSLEGALSADRIVFSPGGNAALLVRLADHAIQVITDLPDAPVIHAVTTAPEPSRTFAVNDEGDVLAGGDAVWLLRGIEPPLRIAASGPVTAMALQRSDALIAGANQVLLVRNLGGASHYHTLSTYSGDDRNPVAVQFSPAADRAFTATADGQISVLNMDGSQLAQLSCRCSPSGFHRLAGASLFRLNETGAGAIWLLEADGEPRLWFVPRPLAVNPPEEAAQ